MRGKQVTILAIAFGLSGFAALTYQITWIKELGSFFGVQVYSATTVLAAFMAGLALGSWIFGRLVDRIRRPLLLFAIMELLLALFAVFFPWIKDFIGLVYKSLYQPDLTILQVEWLRFACAFPILLIATSMMGGTLPVLTRGVTGRMHELGGNITFLYGSNNLGAFFGGFITGYILLQSTGISGALYTGAVLNTLNAIAALWFINMRPSEKEQPYRTQSSPSIIKKYPKRIITIVLWVFAIEGFTTLAYEIVWTRIMLEFSYDKTSYFYTTIIITFVGGLSLGSYILKRFIHRIKDPVRWLAFTEIGIGIVYLLLMVVFVYIAPGFKEFQRSGSSWWSVVVTEQLLIFIMILPPVILMGFTLPLVSVICSDRLETLGSRLGIIGMLDTIGSVIGSVIAGFVLIPLLGSIKTFLLIISINLLLGVWIFLERRPSTRWNLFVIPAFMSAIGILLLLPYQVTFFNNRWNEQLQDPVIYYEEGPAASVAVTRHDQANRALSINGAITAYTLQSDLRVHSMLGALPWFLSDNPPSRALVIGLGLGVTAKTLNNAGIDQIDIAEISPEVIHVASHLFSHLNDSVAYKPHVNVFMEDGRAHLYQTPYTYDLITTNAVHPRLGNSLYTKDFYEICRRKMSANGVLCQWIPTNWMSEKEYRSLIRSFTTVFPNSGLWFINDAHTILAGSMHPLNLSFSSFVNKFNRQEIRSGLSELEYYDVRDVLVQYWIPAKALEDYVDGAPLNTDNLPLVEYSRTVSRQPNLQVLKGLLNYETDFPGEFGELDPSSPEARQLTIEYQQLKDRLEQYVKHLKDQPD